MKYRPVPKMEWKERFTYVKNVVFEADELGQEGARFQIVKFLPHTTIEPHYHEKVREIFYIRSGNGIIRFNGQENRAKADDIFLCEPKDVHEIINDADEELVILIFKTNESPDDIIWPDGRKSE